MQQFTRQAIVKAFIDLLNEEPFDKITVTDITNRCGINRNTFYYYYQDIFALVDGIFRDETSRIIDEHRDYDTWQEGFLEATAFARQNKQAIYHLYNSINRDKLETYLFDVAYNTVSSFVERQAEGMPAKEEDIRDLTVLYTVALEGLVLEWLHDGMQRDPDAYIEHVGTLLDGITRHALYKSCNARRDMPRN